MMRIVIGSLLVLFLSACTESSDEPAVDDSASPGVFTASVDGVRYETSGHCRFVGNQEEFFFTNELDGKPGDLMASVQSIVDPGEKPELLLRLRKVTGNGYVDMSLDETKEFTIHASGATGSGSVTVARKSGGDMDIDYTPKDFTIEVVCKQS